MLSNKRGECEWVILRQKEVTHRHRRRMTIAMEPIHDAEVITIVSIVQGVCVCVLKVRQGEVVGYSVMWPSINAFKVTQSSMNSKGPPEGKPSLTAN